MNNLHRLQTRLVSAGWAAFLIPTTDEYLSEFAQPANRRLQWATGFSGSTGLGIVLEDQAVLFLDARYQDQGRRDTAGLNVEILDTASCTREQWLRSRLRPGDRVALDARLHSYSEIRALTESATEQRLEFVPVCVNPIDELWGAARPPAVVSLIRDYPVGYAGSPFPEKYRKVQEHLEESSLDWMLLTDPEDVAWLLNVRTHDSVLGGVADWHVVPIPLTRALVGRKGQVLWFVEQERLESKLRGRVNRELKLADPSSFESALNELSAGKKVGANLAMTSFRYGQVVANVGKIQHDPFVSHQRWKKNAVEIARAKEGHRTDGQAVIRFLAWLMRTIPERKITELDASRKLMEFRRESNGYLGKSMPLMSASGPSGALPHYVPSEDSNRIINDHPIYWMDSGGQYYGCSTDNTVCFAVRAPDRRHVKVHTLVVKGLVALARARFPVGTSSGQLDSIARQFLWQEGMDYGHGTGHGVGSFMNIHEGPLMSKRLEHPWVVPVEAGMIVSNEPGYYAPGEFGLRVETHMVVVPSSTPGFLEFETISRLPIDPRLIDTTLLTDTETRWLSSYHRQVAECYRGVFDAETQDWLRNIVNAYDSMGSNGQDTIGVKSDSEGTTP